MKWTKRLGSLLLAGCIAVSGLSALAADAGTITLESMQELKAGDAYPDGEPSPADGYVCTKETHHLYDTAYDEEDGGLWRIFENFYDADGKLIRTDLSTADGYNGDLTWYSGDWYSYTYDANGNMTAKLYYDESGENGGWTYTYNADGTIATETQDGYLYTYNYDANGRLIKKQLDGDDEDLYSTSYTYDENGRMTSEIGYYDFLTITYDENGNLVKKEATYQYEYTDYETQVESTATEYYTIEYEYAKLEDVARTRTFTDVSDSDWFAASVFWALNKGITLGTSDTTFSPNNDCTRGQIVTFLWRAANSPEPSSANNPFTDVSADAYYYKAVLWAVEKGITTGTSDTTFSPDATCKRSEAVTFIWRANGKPAAGSSNPFTDVANGEWFTDAVLWAVGNNITNGMTATTFEPNRVCSRGQIVTFLYRAA